MTTQNDISIRSDSDDDDDDDDKHDASAVKYTTERIVIDYDR